MPHTLITTKLTPAELVQKWNEKSVQFEKIRIKVLLGYIQAVHDKALFPCLAIEPFHEQWFYIMVRRKDQKKLIIHLDPITPVLRTIGVRLALSWFTKKIAAFDPQSTTTSSTLSEYLNVLDLPSSKQVEELNRLRQKISSQLKASERRNQAQRFVLSMDGFTPPIDWQEIFGNSNPVEIEIGPGKGKFIFSEAKNHPQRSYLAIEWSKRYLKILTERLAKTNLNNVRILNTDARDIFRKWIGADSVSTVHIYYPDPWWKKRHKKYQLFSEEFLQNVERILVPEGTLQFATDVEELYEFVKALVGSSTSLTRIDEKIYTPGENLPEGLTHFEIKKWKSGHHIYKLSWRK